MSRLAPCLALLLFLAPAPRAQELGPEQVTAAYHDAFEQDDAAALVATWKQAPGLILVTIDADLEGSLELREGSDEPDEEAIERLHRRALFGARAAETATGQPIFVDYAASFVGWDADQQKTFREGQAAFGRARQAAASGDQEAALEAGTECLQKAEGLGDWWGTAMGHAARGQALLALHRPEEGLVALARSRQIHHDLGLRGSEYGNLIGMAQALGMLGRSVRCREVTRQALALGRELGDDAGVTELQKLLDKLGPDEPG